MSRVRIWLTVIGAIALPVVIGLGCSSGSRSSSSTSTQPPTTPPPPTTTLPTTLTMSTTAFTASWQSQVITSSRLVALVFTLEAGVGTVQITSIAVTNTGTVDESTLGGATLYSDSNSDGSPLNETALATATAPANNNDPWRFSLGNPIVLLPSAGAQQYIVTVDGSGVAAALSHIGQTIVAQITSAADIAAVDTAVPPAAVSATGTGSPPSPAVGLGIHDHLLISEIVDSPTAGEYVEIFNPTGATISLANYHLTDWTDPNQCPPAGYHVLATGDNFGPSNPSVGTETNFSARFPASATIAPGQAITIALEGVGFEATYAGQTPTFYIRQGTGTPGGTQMGIWTGAAGQNWTGTAGTGVGFANGGETIVLFYWDGASDVVKDVDLVDWDWDPSGINGPYDKSGLGVDGPDADTAMTTYPAGERSQVDRLDTANRTPAILGGGRTVFQRTNWTEGTESTAGGAGITGHDETQEDFQNTWSSGTSGATPNAVP